MESHNSMGGVRAPLQSRSVAIVAPVIVAFLTLALLLWSAWPVVRPVPEVEVAPVVFERSSQPHESDSNPSQEPASRATKAVQAAGWLEAEPFYVVCTALADGVVETINVLEGEYIERDAVVATLVSEDSEIRVARARAELDASTAVLASAHVELEAAQRSWDEPVALERAVESGRAALEEREGELARLPARIRAARAQLDGLDEELERIERSASRGVATEIEVIRARQAARTQRAEVEALSALDRVIGAQVDRLRAELRAAERDLELRIEDRRRLDNAAAAVRSAEANVARARAALDAAELELSRMTIRAPISGYVQERLKAPGDKVMLAMDSPESAHILHMYDPEQLQVRVDVPLADASFVEAGQPCEVVVEILPDTTFDGVVLRSTHQADLQKNTLEFKVRVITPDPVLRPEMLTRVRFLASDGAVGADPEATGERPLVLVPSAAIDEAGGTPKVWAVTQRRSGRGVLKPFGIEPIESRGTHTLVRTSIAAGSLVLVGDHTPRDGQRVAISPERSPGLASNGGSTP